MKKIRVPNDKKIGVYTAFENKRYQRYEFEDFPPPPAFWTKALSIERKT